MTQTIFDILLLFFVSVVGGGLALHRCCAVIRRLERNVERLEDQIYELREKARAHSTTKKKVEPMIAAVRPALGFKPVVVESLGPPCDPPESGEPYR
ncbi:MAG TPA: hypothetical protein VFA98_11685 [Thermoanaerobaculia bacterium]|nr:hypothetical protein [Thermoanaerobaculia bacterium]